MEHREIKEHVAGGVGFLGWLQLLLAGLWLAEIGKVAGWDWWWVFAPLWIPFALLALVLVVAALILISIRIWETVTKRSRGAG